MDDPHPRRGARDLADEFRRAIRGVVVYEDNLEDDAVQDSLQAL
jgi:hypothetical protein